MSKPNDKSVLVTGGAGYIGSHCVRSLLEAGYQAVVLDNFSTGHRWAVPAGLPVIEGDAGDQDLVSGVIRKFNVDSVLHFAGSIVASESVSDPLKYYENNTCVSRALIQACVTAGISKFLFSSTAAVYGEPEDVPVPESAPLRPINPYGTSKLCIEWMLRDVAFGAQSRGGRIGEQAVDDFRYVCLRYFNVAGARSDGTIGQATPRATHLVKVAAEAACRLRPMW